MGQSQEIEALWIAIGEVGTAVGVQAEKLEEILKRSAREDRQVKFISAIATLIGALGALLTPIALVLIK